MNIRFTLAAQRDITELYRYGAKEFGVAKAEAYAEGFDEACCYIAEFSNAARLRTEYIPPVRIHHYASHYIVYLCDDVGVLIVRVLHHASDITRHLAMQVSE